MPEDWRDSPLLPLPSPGASGGHCLAGSTKPVRSTSGRGWGSPARHPHFQQWLPLPMGFVQPPGFPGPDSGSTLPGAGSSLAPHHAELTDRAAPSRSSEHLQACRPPGSCCSEPLPCSPMWPDRAGAWTMDPVSLPTPPRPGSVLGDPCVQQPLRLSSPECVSCEPRMPPAHTRTQDIRHGPWAAAGAHTQWQGSHFWWRR